MAGPSPAMTMGAEPRVECLAMGEATRQSPSLCANAPRVSAETVGPCAGRPARRRENERHDRSATRRNAALGAGAPLFYEVPLHIVRGEGVYLFDADGRRYVDMYNNVPCVGHANPHVVEAMARQQATLNVHSRYLHEGVIAFAERLAALHGPQIESVILSCSGTEANEVALRMARFATGKRGIVCTNATYHGNSELVGSLTRLGQQPAANSAVRAFPFPEKYRPLAPSSAKPRSAMPTSRNSARRSRISRPPARGSRR